MTSQPAVATTTRHPNLYAHHMWKQQRFFAGFLVLIGIAMTSLLLYQHQLKGTANLIWLLYIPSGLLLAAAFLWYRRRSHVHATDDGLKVSTMFSHVMIAYDTIKSVRVHPLNTHFMDKRKRMVAPMMKPLMDKAALFVRVRGTDEELAAIRKKLGARLMHDDTIAIPVSDADAAAWQISSRLPERLGQNQGGGKRRKRRR